MKNSPKFIIYQLRHENATKRAFAELMIDDGAIVRGERAGCSPHNCRVAVVSPNQSLDLLLRIAEGGRGIRYRKSC